MIIDDIVLVFKLCKLKYLGVKGYDICILLSNDSKNNNKLYNIYVYIHIMHI